MATSATDVASLRPLDLAVEVLGADLKVTVTGHADRDRSVRYRLDASSGADGTANRSSQGGSAKLNAGATVTLISLTLGKAAASQWQVMLYVQPDGQEPYQLSRTGKKK